MKNDCHTNCFTALMLFCIRAGFAKPIRIESSLIRITASHKLILSVSKETTSCTIEKIGNTKEVIADAQKTTDSNKEMSTNIKETPSDMRINTILDQRNDHQHSWKCDLTCVEIPTDIKETDIDIVAIPANIRGNANVHHVNTHQHTWKSYLTLKHCHLTLKKYMTILREQVTETMKSALNAKKYDSSLLHLLSTTKQN